jgi:hypothetical protein
MAHENYRAAGGTAFNLFTELAAPMVFKAGAKITDWGRNRISSFVDSVPGDFGQFPMPDGTSANWKALNAQETARNAINEVNATTATLERIESRFAGASREVGFIVESETGNILNIGRIKLAAAVLGGAKQVVDQAVNYARERKQFGQSIHSYGEIQAKMASMIVKIYASESASYRAGQNIDESILSLKAAGMGDAEAKLKGVEQFAIECAILKVHASEVLDYVVDEGVQIFGGMGFSAEAPMERAYRDSRINRIFEGTNEINRLLAIGTVLKRAMKGEIELMPAAMAVGKEILGVPDFSTSVPDGIFGREYQVIANLKKAILMVAGAALQKFTTAIENEQEILMGVSDMMIEVYVAESTLARVDKLIARDSQDKHQVAYECALVYLHEAVEKIHYSGKEVIMGFAKGDELTVLLMGLKRFTKIAPKNLIESRRLIAQAAIAKNGYIF